MDSPSPERWAAHLAGGTERGATDEFYTDSYVEAQIHGGVTMNDVAEAVFRDPADQGRFGPRLDTLGIPHRIVEEG